MEIEWKPVVGFEGHYEVSNRGDLRSVTRVIMRSNGRKHTWKSRAIKQSTQKRTGYRYAVLCKGGYHRTVRMHRVVAEAFIPNPDDLSMVLHGDGSRTNNAVENLRWGTRSDNSKDAVKHGTFRNGWSDRTHCINGHEFTPENTRKTSKQRHCRTCARENERRYRAEKKALRRVA